MSELPVGAIIGIAAAAVAVVVIMIIAIMVMLSRKESHVLKPIDFLDRPVSGIRGLGVSLVSKHTHTVSKHARPRRQNTKRNVSRHHSGPHDIWTTRESWEFASVPLINRPGSYNNNGKYQPVQARDSGYRTSGLSNDSADRDSFGQFPSRNAVYIPDGVRSDYSHITLNRERSQRISSLSETGHHAQRQSYVKPTVQTFRL